MLDNGQLTSNAPWLECQGRCWTTVS